MTTTTFGADSGSLAEYNGQIAKNTGFTMWTLQTGGSQVTTLQIGGVGQGSNPIVTDSNGFFPLFTDTAGHLFLWADAGAGRYKYYCDLTQIIGSPTTAIPAPSSAPVSTGQIPIVNTVSGPVIVWSYQYDKFAWSVQSALSAQVVGGVITGQLKQTAELPCTFSSLRLDIGTMPTDSAITVDILKNGTTIYTTSGNRPQITVGGASSVLAASAPDVLTAATGDYFTTNIYYSGTTAKDLTVTLRYALTNAT